MTTVQASSATRPHAGNLRVALGVPILVAGLGTLAAWAVFAFIFMLAMYGWGKCILLTVLAPFGLIMLVLEIISNGMFLAAAGFALFGILLTITGALLLDDQAPDRPSRCATGIVGALAALLGFWAIPAAIADAGGRGAWSRWRSDLFTADVLECCLLKASASDKAVWGPDSSDKYDWKQGLRGHRSPDEADSLIETTRSNFAALSPGRRGARLAALNTAMATLIVDQMDGLAGWPDRETAQKFAEARARWTEGLGNHTHSIIRRSSELAHRGTPSDSYLQTMEFQRKIRLAMQEYGSVYEKITGEQLEPAVRKELEQASPAQVR